MKTRLLVVAAIMVATSVTDGAQTSHSTLEEAVWKADAAWAEASASNNVDRMLAFYDANAAFIGTTPPTAGRDRIRALWTSFFGPPGYKLTWKAERVEVAASGDLAYSYGPWEQTELRVGTPRVSKGTYVAVWKKQSDGTWKVLVDKP
jgi:ketosteroid isomerase-like protein